MEHMTSNLISTKLVAFSDNPLVKIAFFLRQTELAKNTRALFERVKWQRSKYTKVNNNKMIITKSFRDDGDPIEAPKVRNKAGVKALPSTPRPTLDDYYERHNVNMNETWCCHLSDNEIEKMIQTYRFAEFLSFRRNLLSLKGGSETLSSMCEWLRSDEVRKLWEIEANEKATNGKNKVRDNERWMKHKEKRTEEFMMRQLLKNKLKYYSDVENNTLDHFQVIEALAPYLSQSSLLDVNHDMSTQINESLNRSMTAMAPKDRVFNGSNSLECRQAVVVLKRNCGHGKYLMLICNENIIP